MHGIKIGIASAKGRRGLKQDVGRKKLIGHGNGAETGDAQSAQRDFVQEIAPGDLVSSIPGERHSRFCFTHEWRTISSIWTKFGSRSKTSKASMVMVWTGQRSAQRPQRMQIVSSLTITEPGAVDSSSSERWRSSLDRESDMTDNCSRVSSENSNWLSGTSCRQF